MAIDPNIRFRDLPRRDKDERNRLRARWAYLKQKKDKRGTLADDESDEFARLDAIVGPTGVIGQTDQPAQTERVDPLFVAVRDLFNGNPALINGSGSTSVNNWVDDGDNGKIQTCPPASTTFSEVAAISLVIGILSTDGAVPPRVIAQMLRGAVPAHERDAPKFTRLSRIQRTRHSGIS